MQESYTSNITREAAVLAESLGFELFQACRLKAESLGNSQKSFEFSIVRLAAEFGIDTLREAMTRFVSRQNAKSLALLRLIACDLKTGNVRSLPVVSQAIPGALPASVRHSVDALIAAEEALARGRDAEKAVAAAVLEARKDLAFWQKELELRRAMPAKRADGLSTERAAAKVQAAEEALAKAEAASVGNHEPVPCQMELWEQLQGSIRAIGERPSEPWSRRKNAKSPTALAYKRHVIEQNGAKNPFPGGARMDSSFEGQTSKSEAPRGLHANPAGFGHDDGGGGEGDDGDLW